MGRLDVRIVEAKNLPNVGDLNGKSDPYIVCTIDTTSHKTSVQKATLNPKFDEVFKFVVADPESAQLEMKIFDKNALSDDFIGEYSMSLNGLTKGEVKDSWCLLKQCKTQGELRVRLVAHDFGAEPTPAATAAVAAASPVAAPVPTDVPQEQPAAPPAQQPAVPVAAPVAPAPPPPPPTFEQPQWGTGGGYHAPHLAEKAANDAVSAIGGALGLK